MADAIKDLLNQKKYEQPDEITYILNFVEKKYSEKPQVKIARSEIIIVVSNASLANLLRFDLFRLQKELQTAKRLVIRINS